jgi:hypothetical protein
MKNKVCKKILNIFIQYLAIHSTLSYKCLEHHKKMDV